MESMRPIHSDSKAVCKDCGTEWLPLYTTVEDLLENAACPICGAQSYEYEGVRPVHTADD